MKEVSAGGVVYFEERGCPYILLIEDRYSRWTLPKGKQEPGETLLETALREIEEETGVKGRIIAPLNQIGYSYFHPDHGDVEKEVHYYLVETDILQFLQAKAQLSEIDQIAWFTPQQAWEKQRQDGYDNNHQILLQALLRLESKGFVDEKGVSTLTQQDLASLIDHTLLKPEATAEQIDRLCQEAAVHHFASVCVNPTWVARAAQRLEGTDVKVCTVVGFPLGASHTEIKAVETKRAIQDGAQEIDMVMNIGALKSGDLEAVRRDITAVVEAADGVLVKVILETGLLSADEIRIASEQAKAAGAHFVKTSTGFGNGGATVEAVALMRQTVGPDLGVKASGGVRDRKTAEAMIRAGATRIGASASIAIVTGGVGNEGY
ncbi:deoxyribose-phosphate aldolase [Desmospora activa DSM 45169]|uniref:Deoxyribose-phosphate aldolase n=1 Tax=Desmospora activa DSM 45169 TaxID=1121389 RepID=A0A2T4ZC85_9BACL|nr:deoxyribose-phosphate aldolase [Desmospora activa DSM 45169]